jgi:hypothetical protein
LQVSVLACFDPLDNILIFRKLKSASLSQHPLNLECFEPTPIFHTPFMMNDLGGLIENSITAAQSIS